MLIEKSIAIFVDESGNTMLDDQTRDQRFYVSTAIIATHTSTTLRKGLILLGAA